MKILFIFLLMGFGISLSADKPETIENGLKPKGKGLTLKLTEDLRFGPETGEGDEYLWPGTAVQVEADARGHIYLVDPIQRRLLEFDDQGGFVRLVGGPGQGPGEFQFLATFQILADGSAVAFGNGGPTTIVNYYDTALQYKDRKSITSMAAILNALRFSPNGKNRFGMVTALQMEVNEMRIAFGTLTEDYKIDTKLAEITTMSFNPQRVMEPAFWSEFLADQFTQGAKGGGMVFAFDKDNNLFTAENGVYEITKWDPNYKKIRVIKREYTPIKMAEEDIDAITGPVQEALVANLPPQLQEIVTPNVIRKAVEMADFPAFHLPVNNLLTTPDGKLIVINYQSLATRKGIGDIFSPDGKYQGSFEHGNNGLLRMVFKNGYAYTVETDDMDDNHVVRYKVEWVPTR